MKYDEFLAQVEQRADLGREQAQRAIAATLATLGQRLEGGEPKDLAAQLPPELAQYLEQPLSGAGESFSLDDFFKRISEQEGVPLAEAAYSTRIIIALLSEVVTQGEIENVRAQLPADFSALFNVQNEGQIPGQGVINTLDTDEGQELTETNQQASQGTGENIPTDLYELEPKDTYKRVPEQERPKPAGKQPPFVSDMGVDVDHPFPPTNLFPEKP